jgi:5-bromo-4-chloroindolyl phosphate hydrolysis protein
MFGSLFRDDRNWLVGGFFAALLLPMLVFGLDMPFLVALPIAVLAFIGAVFLLAPRQLFEGINVSNVARGRLDVVRGVLEDANQSLRRLENAASAIASPTVRSQTLHLVKTAKSIIFGVEQDPDRLSSVQRFLTYYLPSAGDIATSYAVMEKQNNPDPERVRKTEAVIKKLDEAFGHYADSLHESDLSNLDVELRLVESAVKDDLEPRQ